MHDFRPVMTLISKEKSDFMRALNRSNIKYEIINNNFQKLIDKERVGLWKVSRKSFPSFDYNSTYHTYEDIVSELKMIGTKGWFQLFLSHSYINILWK